MSAIVECTGLGRWYGEVIGLGDLTVSIEPGITGLLGPNGAGKSTFMKLMVGELKPSRGTIRVLGHQPFANLELFKDLGFCPQQDALYDHMTGLGFVEHLLRLSGTPRKEARTRAIRAMERVHLEDSMERRCAGYSKGMRQRTRLAQAIAHEPKLLVVDEPLTGLDPIARHQTLELFREFVGAGVSLIVSSHVLHEVQSLTETIVMIHRGRLLAQGTVAEVRKLLARHPRKVRVTAREPRRLAEAIIRMEHVRSVSLPHEGGQLIAETGDVDAFFQSLPAMARELRAGVQGLDSSDDDLEAVFDYLVG